MNIHHQLCLCIPFVLEVTVDVLAVYRFGFSDCQLVLITTWSPALKADSQTLSSARSIIHVWWWWFWWCQLLMKQFIYVVYSSRSNSPDEQRWILLARLSALQPCNLSFCGGGCHVHPGIICVNMIQCVCSFCSASPHAGRISREKILDLHDSNLQW